MSHLTFENGKFVLTQPNLPRQHTSWEHVGVGKWSTTNIVVAKALKNIADPIAKKVLSRSLTKYYIPNLLPPLKFLDPHQREGIQWILTRSRSYLAHAPGAGKTCQAIVSSLLTTSSGSILFIVPPSLTTNWQRETKAFSNLMGIYSTVSIVPTSNKKNEMDWGADFIICPDSMLTKPWVYKNLLKLKPKFIAVDEASRFKEFTSQRSKAFYGGKTKTASYPGLFQEVDHVVFLDGSPMPNRPIELWAPAYALNPECIDGRGYYEFGLHYCGAFINKYNQMEFRGATREEELKQKLQEKFMHVVEEAKLKHPERRRSILVMNEDVRTPEMKAWEQKNVSSLNFTYGEKLNKGQIATHRLQLGLRKAKWVSSYVADRLTEKNESILLFAWHREVCEALALFLKEHHPFIVYGGVSNDRREEAFRRYQRGERRLIIGNIQAMGRGHNLQRTSRIIFAEFSWSDELNKQCEKRASRRGSNRSFVRSDYIAVPDSLDEVVLGSVFRKEKTVKKIIG